MSPLDLRRQLHAAWVRLRRGAPGSRAAHELAVGRWYEGLCASAKDAIRRGDEGFALEHLKTTGRTIDACDPLTCPYGS